MEGIVLNVSLLNLFLFLIKNQRNQAHIINAKAKKRHSHQIEKNAFFSTIN